MIVNVARAEKRSTTSASGHCFFLFEQGQRLSTFEGVLLLVLMAVLDACFRRVGTSSTLIARSDQSRKTSYSTRLISTGNFAIAAAAVISLMIRLWVNPACG